MSYNLRPLDLCTDTEFIQRLKFLRQQRLNDTSVTSINAHCKWIWSIVLFRTVLLCTKGMFTPLPFLCLYQLIKCLSYCPNKMRSIWVGIGTNLTLHIHNLWIFINHFKPVVKTILDWFQNLKIFGVTKSSSYFRYTIRRSVF